jgi:alkylation response protein AidB-like acyl-CoA dehydrogenase
MSDLDAYRTKARAWLAERAATFGLEARRGLTHEEDIALGRTWQRTKYEAGYAGIAWPKEHGGQGLSELEKLVFDQEEMKHHFPNVYFGVSLGMPVPILLRHGPPGWKVERAIAALKGEEIWCQLFSEPAAGSDLAGLRTRAVKDGDDWILTGQKLWTSWAHLSDYGVIVARTDPTAPKHRGLTYFWVDMKAPGVTVRPVKLAAGDSHVNEVFFDDVRLSDAQRMGPVGGGFAVAMETLFIERYGAQDPAGFGPPLSVFVELARGCEIEGRPALTDGRVRQQIARAYATRSALDAISKRALLMLAAGREPGPEGSLNKLVSVRSRQRLSEFAIDLMGVCGVMRDDRRLPQEDWVESWIGAPTNRIAGGADEMLLNTIAEKILGLPQDHRPDKNVPFSQIP